MGNGGGLSLTYQLQKNTAIHTKQMLKRQLETPANSDHLDQSNYNFTDQWNKRIKTLPLQVPENNYRKLTLSSTNDLDTIPLPLSPPLTSSISSLTGIPVTSLLNGSESDSHASVLTCDSKFDSESVEDAANLFRSTINDHNSLSNKVSHFPISSSIDNDSKINNYNNNNNTSKNDKNDKNDLLINICRPTSIIPTISKLYPDTAPRNHHLRNELKTWIKSTNPSIYKDIMNIIGIEDKKPNFQTLELSSFEKRQKQLIEKKQYENLKNNSSNISNTDSESEKKVYLSVRDENHIYFDSLSKQRLAERLSQVPKEKESLKKKVREDENELENIKNKNSLRGDKNESEIENELENKKNSLRRDENECEIENEKVNEDTNETTLQLINIITSLSPIANRPSGIRVPAYDQLLRKVLPTTPYPPHPHLQLPFQKEHIKSDKSDGLITRVLPKAEVPKVLKISKVTTQVKSIRRHCISCLADSSPCWRPSWDPDAGQLCNSCGLRYKKTGARCLNDRCSRIPSKGEWLLMESRARAVAQGNSGRVASRSALTPDSKLNYTCLTCGTIVEVKKDLNVYY